MKKRTAALSVFLVFAFQMLSVVTADPQSTQDNGSSCNILSADARLWFVVGYENGLKDGFEEGIQFTASKSEVDGKQAPPPQTAMYNLSLHNAPRTAGSRHPSKGEIIDEMTLFYKDFRNTPVCWGEAEQIAQLTLMGATPSDVDLDAIRSEDAKNGCQ
jgi:hypothetical protein